MNRKQAPEPSRPVALPEKAAKRQKMTDAEQSAEFERVAREHGAEGNEKSFNESLRKITARAQRDDPR